MRGDIKFHSRTDKGEDLWVVILDAAGTKSDPMSKADAERKRDKVLLADLRGVTARSKGPAKLDAATLAAYMAARGQGRG